MSKHERSPEAESVYPVGVLAVLGARGWSSCCRDAARPRARRGADARADVAAGPRVEVRAARASRRASAPSTVQGEARPYAERDPVRQGERLSARGARRQGRPGQGQPGDRGDRVARDSIVNTRRRAPTPTTSARSPSGSTRSPGRGVVSTQDAEQAAASAEVAEASVAALDDPERTRRCARRLPATVTARFADPGALMQNASSRADRRAAGGDHLAGRSGSACSPMSISTTRRWCASGDRGDPRARPPGASRTGRVSRLVAASSISQTRTMLIEIDFDNQDGAIFPGSFVEVTMDGARAGAGRGAGRGAGAAR